MTKEDLEELSKKMRYNLTALQAQLSDMQRGIASLVPPDEPSHRCECGWTGRSTVQFQEHRYRQHDGAVPEHYLAAERAAGYEALFDEITAASDARAAEEIQADAFAAARADVFEAARLTGSIGERATESDGSRWSGRVS